MLQNVPRAPQKISAQKLQILLEKHGFEVHQRSIQRDLQKLSAVFPLQADRNKPRGWWFEKSAPALNIPGMNLYEAITFPSQKEERRGGQSLTDPSERIEVSLSEKESDIPRRIQSQTSVDYDMSDTVLRYLFMLQNIPRAPQKTSAQKLRILLAEQGHSVHERSIQRDLHKLSALFPIVADDNKPRGWWFQKHAPTLDIPGMNLHQAITFRMVEQTLQNQLPKPTARYLKGYFKEASKKLATLDRSGLPKWNDKVRSVSRSQSLLPPTINAQVLDDIYNALLNDTQVHITYASRAKNQKTKRTLNPLGLIFRGALPYLVASENDEDAKTYALPRISKSERSLVKIQKPKGFSLDEFMEQGEISFPVAKAPISLVCRFSKNAIQTFVETPLSKDQSIREQKGEHALPFTLKAKVHDTKVLRAFLISFGNRCEIVRPKKLRDAIKRELQDTLSHYE